jgi:hypothetical protein
LRADDPAFNVAAELAAHDGRNRVYGFKARLDEHALDIGARMAVPAMELQAIGSDIVTALDGKAVDNGGPDAAGELK